VKYGDFLAGFEVPQGKGFDIGARERQAGN